MLMSIPLALEAFVLVLMSIPLALEAFAFRLMTIPVGLVPFARASNIICRLMFFLVGLMCVGEDTDTEHPVPRFLHHGTDCFRLPQL